jgi:prevent-host-death family protein
MEITITATEANRQFSKLLRGVREGNTYTITSHGETVARLLAGAPDAAERRRRSLAKRRLMEHLRTRPALHIPPWTRDELYEDES